MKEQIDSSLEKKEISHINIQSNLERVDGLRENFKIDLLPDGKPRIVAFCDIDKTFIHLEPAYEEIRKALWPEAVKKEGIAEVNHVHLGGFKLGTMWRELDRMHRIYELGQEKFKDVEIYKKEILGRGMEGEHIDTIGDTLHEEMDVKLKNYDEVAAEVIEQMYKKDPNSFDKGKIGPVYHLADIYKRLGVPMVAMSANPKKFLNAVLKYAGLSEHFIDCASDTDVPGLKEYKMKYLINILENKGLEIPYDRLVIIGDSAEGDVGSGPRFKKLMNKEEPDLNIVVKGLLVVDNEKDLQNTVSSISHDRELCDSVQALDLSGVPISKVDGAYLMAGKNKEKFLKQL